MGELTGLEHAANTCRGRAATTGQHPISGAQSVSRTITVHRRRVSRRGYLGTDHTLPYLAIDGSSADPQIISARRPVGRHRAIDPHIARAIHVAAEQWFHCDRPAPLSATRRNCRVRPCDLLEPPTSRADTSRLRHPGRGGAHRRGPLAYPLNLATHRHPRPASECDPGGPPPCSTRWPHAWTEARADRPSTRRFGFQGHRAGQDRRGERGRRLLRRARIGQ